MKKTETPFGPADILLPDSFDSADMTRWAVVACDQFTSEPEYWRDADSIAGDAPSALRLILPEAYLECADADERIGNIHKAMEDYLSRGIFTEYKDALIYLERTDSAGRLRQGVVGMVDLEAYDFSQGSSSPVRATEATVAQRIPPRLKVRRNAALELPHVMLLTDDREKTAIEPLALKKASFKKLYDFKLMKDGGSAAGYLMTEEAGNAFLNALSSLSRRDAFERRCGITGAPLLLYAVGDGNHSLATAKEYYEELKRKNPDRDMSRHPARYALAELVNLHSDALTFEPIHRIVTGTDTAKLLADMTEELRLSEAVGTDAHGDLQWVCGGEEKSFVIGAPLSELPVGSVQIFLDKYLSENPGGIDYIHGDDTLKRLAQKPGSAGILLSAMKKEELFPAVIRDGALPRKTFSMGHARDKRYYIEARLIRGDNI